MLSDYPRADRQTKLPQERPRRAGDDLHPAHHPHLSHLPHGAQLQGAHDPPALDPRESPRTHDALHLPPHHDGSLRHPRLLRREHQRAR